MFRTLGSASPLKICRAWGSHFFKCAPTTIEVTRGRAWDCRWCAAWSDYMEARFGSKARPGAARASPGGSLWIVDRSAGGGAARHDWRPSRRSVRTPTVRPRTLAAPVRPLGPGSGKLPEALARVRHDAVLSGAARRASRRHALLALALLRRVLPAHARGWAVAALVAMMAGIIVNALTLQHARHLPPFFAVSPPVAPVAAKNSPEPASSLSEPP